MITAVPPHPLVVQKLGAFILNACDFTKSPTLFEKVVEMASLTTNRLVFEEIRFVPHKKMK